MIVKLRSGTFKPFTVCWCQVEHCYQAITSKCSIHTFTLSRHVLYMFTPVSLLVFTSHFCWVSIFYYGAVLGSSSVFRKPQWGFFHCFCDIHIYSVEFCISGIFGFAMQCVLHIYIILDLYLFWAAPFCCSVFWGTIAWLHTSYFVRPCFVSWTAVGYSVFYSVM